jgi:hypothetical protein
LPSRLLLQFAHIGSSLVPSVLRGSVPLLVSVCACPLMLPVSSLQVPAISTNSFPRFFLVLFVLANSSSYFTTPFRLPSVLGNPILHTHNFVVRVASLAPPGPAFVPLPSTAAVAKFGAAVAHCIPPFPLPPRDLRGRGVEARDLRGYDSALPREQGNQWLQRWRCEGEAATAEDLTRFPGWTRGNTCATPRSK